MSDLAAEFAAGVSGFDAETFHDTAVAGLAGQCLMDRIDWIADCLEPQLAGEFPLMADQLEAAMPPPLDPAKKDNDFGRFIHAVPRVLAVRHGLEDHRERALDLLHAATRRFSMEFYIRPFLNRWPEETLARLEVWAADTNYHVRRLVSEGTRPNLPWARKIALDPLVPLRFLDRLYVDDTRFVTRSVSNHLNDLSKTDPEVIVGRLARWQREGRQADREMAWITRHALRTLVKRGMPEALSLLGYRDDAEITAELRLGSDPTRIGGVLNISCEIRSPSPVPVLVDYILHFHRPSGRAGRKVFKLKQAMTDGRHPLILNKRHMLKGDATTFTLYPGPHRIEVQVNGRIVAGADFDLLTGNGA